MKTLKYIGIGLACILGIFAIVPAFLSNSLKVVRSTTVQAPKDSVFGYFADFNNFKSWSPWQELDPSMTTSVVGAGVGSIYSWKGNDQVGSGRMTITEVSPNQNVVIKLEFIEPWEGLAGSKWIVEQTESGSKVSWEMTQDLSYFKRYFGLMMDGMIGPDFEKGLNKLKANLEKK